MRRSVRASLTALTVLTAVAAGAGAMLAGPAAQAATQPVGMDVSAGQANVDWGRAKANGASIAYVKATEGAGYVNGYFAQQYNGSHNAGLIRGAYHFALPDRTDGATQADYFVAHGGGWSADGRTLPGALDIEYNPYGATCYGKSAADMVAWLHAFLDRYRQRTGRDAVIYTTTDWWRTCTADSAQFSANPLWIAAWGSSAGTMPASWSYPTFWQYADSGIFPGDQDRFNGSPDRLSAFAKGTASTVRSLAPRLTVLANNTANCAGSTQYYTATDSNGVPIDWTYANGRHACVKVGYAPAVTGQSCSFAFYVPAGYATGEVVFGYWTTDGAKHYASLDENPVNGWRTVFVARDVNRIEFQDNNGQSGTRIGWGSTAAYGIMQVC